MKGATRPEHERANVAVGVSVGVGMGVGMGRVGAFWGFAIVIVGVGVGMGRIGAFWVFAIVIVGVGVGVGRIGAFWVFAIDIVRFMVCIVRVGVRRPVVMLVLVRRVMAVRSVAIMRRFLLPVLGGPHKILMVVDYPTVCDTLAVGNAVEQRGNVDVTARAPDHPGTGVQALDDPLN